MLTRFELESRFARGKEETTSALSVERAGSNRLNPDDNDERGF